jgi:hypothetical protein
MLEDKHSRAQIRDAFDQPWKLEFFALVGRDPSVYFMVVKFEVEAFFSRAGFNATLSVVDLTSMMQELDKWGVDRRDAFKLYLMVQLSR